jgi:hypothetical protein
MQSPALLFVLVGKEVSVGRRRRRRRRRTGGNCVPPSPLPSTASEKEGSNE